MARALNIKIKDTIYSQLDQYAKKHDVTKTQIVEIDVDNQNKTDIEAFIYTRLALYLQGVSCQIPDVDTNVEDSVDTDVDKLTHDVDINVEDSVESSVDNTEKPKEEGAYDGTGKPLSPDKIDTVAGLAQAYPNGLNQGQLAQRLNCAPSTITRYKKKSIQEWDEFCSNRDPLSCYWKQQCKRFYPTNGPTDPNWQLTDAHSS
jgi:hypothetical protein